MKKNNMFFALALMLNIPLVAHATETPPSTNLKDDVDDLVDTIKKECMKGVNSCLSVMDDEDVRRASSATSVDIGLFGQSSSNSLYEDDAHYYRYKTAKTVTEDVFKIGIGFHIAANLENASLMLSGSMNGIGIEGKPSKGSTQLRIDLVGIDYADSSHDLYAAIPISIELDSDSIKRLGNSLSEKVKAALSDKNNVKLYVCPQVVDIRSKSGADAGEELRRRALQLQTELNLICANRFPNATMRFTNDVKVISGSANAPAVATASGSRDSKTVFQEYRRYRYDVTNKEGSSYGSVALYGAKMYLTGLENTGSLTSIANALFSLKGKHTTSAVQYMGYGLKTAGVMLTDISGTQIGQPTYVVNVYRGFQNAKDEIDRSANEAPKVLAAASDTPEQKKVNLENAGNKATNDINAAMQQIKDAVASGDTRKTEAAASEAASKAVAATTALSNVIKAASTAPVSNPTGAASIPLSNINAVGN